MICLQMHAPIYNIIEKTADPDIRNRCFYTFIGSGFSDILFSCHACASATGSDTNIASKSYNKYTIPYFAVFFLLPPTSKKLQRRATT